MGCDIFSFVPDFCKTPLALVYTRANGVYFDYTALRRSTRKEPAFIFGLVDLIIQRLQPTHFIFLAVEGVSPICKTQKKYENKREITFNAEKFNASKEEDDKFIKLVQNKIKSDPTRSRPKAFFSTYQTPN